MKNKAIILLITLTILLSGFVSSELIIETYSADFYTAAKPSPTICMCGELKDEITIINNAPYPQIFYITSNIERADISVKQITALPQQEIIVPIMLRASCDEKPKTEEYDVTIRSTTGAQQVIQRNLEIQECQTIKTKLYTDKNITNICTPTTYQITLENPSTFEESYLIGPLNNIEWFNTIGYEVTLKPKQKSILNFTFTPSCDISGEITNKFRLQAQKSKLEAELTHNLYIQPGYNYTIIGEEELNLCRYEKIRIPYTIKNEGLINNTYEINLKGNPDFITLIENLSIIEPGDIGTFFLEINPGFKTKQTYNFEIITKTNTGNAQATKNIQINLNNCYDLTLQIVNPENLQVCQGIHNLEVLMRNNGNKTETYKLNTNTNTATLSNYTVTLKPQQQETINLKINSTIFNQKILFEVIAISTRNLTTNWSDSILLDIVSTNDCTKITFPARYNVYSRYYEENVSIIVKNTGIQGELYKITYFGDDLLEIKEKQTFIEAGETYEVILNKTRATEKNEEYYFALEFETTSGQKYNKEYKLVITSTPITEQIRDYAIENPCFLVTLIIVTIIILYLLSLLLLGAYINKTTKVILLAILIILIIVSLTINGFPKKINPELEQPQDPYLFRIYEDETLKINLNEYIKDPDEDELNFTIEDNANYLKLELDNQTITITPNNYTGNDRFRITADDGRGGLVVTPRFNVEVIAKKTLTKQELYEFFCPHINIALLIFLLIITLLTKTTKKKEKPKKATTQNKTEKKAVKKKEKPKKAVKKKPGRPPKK